MALEKLISGGVWHEGHPQERLRQQMPRLLRQLGEKEEETR